MLSFIVILKDLVYTFCYTGNLLATGNVENSCKDSLELAGLFIIHFPICFRIMQEFNKFVRCRIKKEYHHSHFHMINCLKYVVYLINYTLNFLTKSYDGVIIAWVVVAIFSTIYSYIWDVTYDWGFFQKNQENKFLRKDLAYPSKFFYYIALFLNFFMRMGWLLLLSPNVVDSLVYEDVLALFLSIMEQFRRTLWNYFKIELQHLKFIGNFNIL